LINEYSNSIKDFTTAIELKSNYALAYHDRAVARSTMGDMQGALYDYKMAVNFENNFPLAFNNMGSVKIALGDYEGALADYSVAIKLKPDFYTAYNNRGSAKYYLGQPDSALSDFNKAIELQQNYIPAMNNKAAILSNRAEYAQSISLFDEIITSDKAAPEKEWLAYVQTPRARAAIKNALKTESKDRIQKGMALLESKLAEEGFTPNSETVKKIMAHFDILNKDELYSKIALGIIDFEILKKALRKNPARNIIKYWDLRLIGFKKEKPETEEEVKKIDKNVPFLLRENVDNSGQSYEIAKCCSPIPGDEVTGYMSPEGAIIIHKPKCPVAIRIMSNEGNRIIAVKWTIHKLVSFLARIFMSGIDRVGLVNDISRIISTELNVNMRNFNLSVHNGIFEGTIDLYVHHTQDLNNLIMKLSDVKGIENVKRVEDFAETDVMKQQGS